MEEKIEVIKKQNEMLKDILSIARKQKRAKQQKEDQTTADSILSQLEGLS